MLCKITPDDFRCFCEHHGAKTERPITDCQAKDKSRTLSDYSRKNYERSGQFADIIHVMKSKWILVCCLFVMLSLGAAMPCLFGETLEQRGYQAVDQLYDDIDPLNNSLRQRSSGLANIGETTAVFRPVRGDKRLYYIANGMVASYDRSDYTIVRRRLNIDIYNAIPPNTVFHIGLPKVPDEPEADIPVSPNLVDGRVDSQRTERDKMDHAKNFASESRPLSEGEKTKLRWKRLQNQANLQRKALGQALENLID